MVLNIGLYMVGAIILFFIGIYCIVAKRNAIKTVIGIEIITTAIHLNFIALGIMVPPYGVVDPLAQGIVIMSMIVGAAIATLALMLIIRIYGHYKTVDLRKVSRLRW
jgi:multisubunit Na+/H+ antiporter MnhC subunit